MYNPNGYLLDAYRSTPQTLQALLRGYLPKTISPPKQLGEEWSAAEVICHLRDTEDASLIRMRLMRDQIDPQLSARDPEKLAIDLKYASTPLEEALSAFLGFREQHIQELAALTEEQWERTGQYPWAGQITIRELIVHNIVHDAIHLAQISRQLEAD